MSQHLLKQGNKNMLLDLGTNQLTFLDNRFYRSESGQYFPSVTTILDCYPKSAQFYEWLKKVGENADEIRDEAGMRGSAVHKLTEDYDNGLEVSVLNESGFVQYKVSEWAMMMRYAEFRQNHPTEVIYNELTMVSNKYQFGGTVDRVMLIDGKVFIVDIKTSNALHKHYWLQLEAYAKMLEEVNGLKVDGVAILWLNAKTRTEGKKGAIQGKGWQLCTCTDKKERSQSWGLFQACQRLWLAEYGELTPKHTTYRIKMKYNVEAVA